MIVALAGGPATAVPSGGDGELMKIATLRQAQRPRKIGLMSATIVVGSGAFCCVRRISARA